jgi:hypothetical protein
MSLTLLERLMIDCAGAAEHYVNEAYRTGYVGSASAWKNLVAATEAVKKQREFLKAHSEWPEKS